MSHINSIPHVYAVEAAKKSFTSSMTTLGQTLNRLTPRLKDIELTELQDEVQRAKDLYKRFSKIDTDKVELEEMEQAVRQVKDAQKILDKIEVRRRRRSRGGAEVEADWCVGDFEDEGSALSSFELLDRRGITGWREGKLV